MKTVNVLRFVCLVLAWYSTRAENIQTRAEQPTVDDRVKVNRAPAVRGPGMQGCKAPPVSSYNVRVQSVKTSGKFVYTRQLVTTADLPCFKNSVTEVFPKATTIANCAEATAKKGLNSFSWESGTCTAYLAWRPQKRADCKDGGSKVVYVVEVPLTPFKGGEIIISGEIRYDDPPKVFLDFSHRYDFCGFSSKMHKGYKLLLKSSDVVMLPEGKGTYSLSPKLMCSGSVSISLWSVGADGKVNSEEKVMTIEGSSNHFYELQTGGCVYDAQRQGSYHDSLQYCKAMDNGSLYYEEVDGGAIAFLDAIKVSGFPVTMPFYVGLQYQGNDTWTWLGGLSQSSYEDLVWIESPPTDAYECANAEKYGGDWRLMARTDCNNPFAVVCYFPNP